MLGLYVRLGLSDSVSRQKRKCRTCTPAQPKVHSRFLSLSIAMEPPPGPRFKGYSQTFPRLWSIKPSCFNGGAVDRLADHHRGGDGGTFSNVGQSSFIRPTISTAPAQFSPASACGRQAAPCPESTIRRNSCGYDECAQLRPESPLMPRTPDLRPIGPPGYCGDARCVQQCAEFQRPGNRDIGSQSPRQGRPQTRGLAPRMPT